MGTRKLLENPDEMAEDGGVSNLQWTGTYPSGSSSTLSYLMPLKLEKPGLDGPLNSQGLSSDSPCCLYTVLVMLVWRI